MFELAEDYDVDEVQLFFEILPYFLAARKMQRVLAKQCPDRVNLNDPPDEYRHLPRPLQDRRYPPADAYI